MHELVWDRESRNWQMRHKKDVHENFNQPDKNWRDLEIFWVEIGGQLSGGGGDFAQLLKVQ